MITVTVDGTGAVIGLHADHASSVHLRKVDATLHLTVTDYQDEELSVTLDLDEERPYVVTGKNLRIVQEKSP